MNEPKKPARDPGVTVTDLTVLHGRLYLTSQFWRRVFWPCSRFRWKPVPEYGYAVRPVTLNPDFIVFATVEVVDIARRGWSPEDYDTGEVDHWSQTYEPGVDYCLLSLRSAGAASSDGASAGHLTLWHRTASPRSEKPTITALDFTSKDFSTAMPGAWRGAGKCVDLVHAAEPFVPRAHGGPAAARHRSGADPSVRIVPTRRSCCHGSASVSVEGELEPRSRQAEGSEGKTAGGCENLNVRAKI